MRRTYFTSIVVLSLIVVGTLPKAPLEAAQPVELTEQLRSSLVYLEASVYSYSTFQPWRHQDLSKRVGYGCAVGPYQILTTAYNVADAAFVTVRRFGQNELIPAQVKVVDYESDLSLLELDRQAAGPPLQPITFDGTYEKGAAVDFYWFSEDSRIQSGRGYIDRV